MNKYLKDEHTHAGSLTAFKPILKAWIDVQNEYSNAKNENLKSQPEDYAYYYGERSCVGFLAASVWRCGGVALEEWGTVKGKKPKTRNGRCDLYIKYKSTGYFIEAKHQSSQATGTLENELRFINDKLDLAVEEAEGHHPCDPSNQIGIVFVAPFFPKGKQDDMGDKISKWLECIFEGIKDEKGSIPGVKYSATAWLFQDRRKLQKIKNDIVSPGVVLLARSAMDK